MRKIFLMCQKYLRSHLALLVTYITLCICVSLFGMVTPYITGSFIDELVKAASTDFLWFYCGLFAALNIAQTLIGYVSGRMYVHLQMKMGYEFNRNTIEHVQKVSLNYSDNQDSAYLSQRINNDTNNLIIFCIGIIQNVIVNALSIIMPFCILFFFNKQIAFLIIGLTATYVVVYRLTKKPLYRISMKFQEAQSEFFGKINEQLNYIKFVKVQSIAKLFIARLEKSFHNLLSVTLKRQKISYIFSGLDGIIAVFMQIILFLVGGYAVLNKSLTIGQFTIISTYFHMLLSAARYFFNLGKSVQETRVAATRISEIQAVPEQLNGSHIINRVDNIKLDKITFGYGENKILSDYSFEFTRGQTYAIRGLNGSGKTTLISLILGLYVGEHEGQIFYNETLEDDIDMVTLRKNNIGVAQQESTALADSIGYNLTLSEESESQTAEIDELFSLFGLEQFMSSKQDGMNSKINYSADNISGGERQKISLTRALLKNPDVLILDEPTSAMDLDSKQRFVEYLKEIKREKIIIIVTHDEDISHFCDVSICL